MPMTKEQIEAACKEYNDAQPEGSKRLIASEHDFFCRCVTCWYKYDGAARDKKHGPGNWRSTEAAVMEDLEADRRLLPRRRY